MTTTDSADASAAPDLPTAVLGWRQWRLELVAGRPRLASPVRWARWEPGVAMVSRCRDAGHCVPTDGCGCGIYAARALGTAAKAAAGPPTAMVIGRVALWGELVEGEHGWRAEQAYPSMLIVDPSVDDALVDALGAGVQGPAGRADRRRRLVGRRTMLFNCALAQTHPPLWALIHNGIRHGVAEGATIPDVTRERLLGLRDQDHPLDESWTDRRQSPRHRPRTVSPVRRR